MVLAMGFVLAVILVALEFVRLWVGPVPQNFKSTGKVADGLCFVHLYLRFHIGI